MKNLTPLGHARVYRHPLSGELVVDTDSLRRTQFAGADDFGGYDDFEGYDDDFEGYDDFEGDDFGLFRRNPDRQRQRRDRRMQRKRQRVDRRYQRKTDRLDRKSDRWGLNDDDNDDPAQDKGDRMGWGMTAIGGTQMLATAGSTAIRVRLQHDFRAEDITFTGSSPGATVTSIFFGDRVVWSASDGIDVSVFASNGFLRGLLKGQSIGAGLDVTINGALPDAGIFSATLTGKKPVRPGC